MRIRATRALATTAGAMVLTVLSVGGTPAWADTAAVAGDCAATLAAEEGTDLTVDPGALVRAPGVLDLGLGSTAAGAGGTEDPTVVSIPLADAAGALGAEAVSDATEPVCDAVQDTAGEVQRTTQRALAVVAPAERPDPRPHPAGDTDAPGDPAPPAPEEDTENSGDEPARGDRPEGSVAGSTVPEFDVSYVTPASPASTPFSGHPLSPPDFSTLPDTPSDFGLEPAKEQAAGEGNPGRVDALTAADQRQSRAPFIIAVALIAVVAAALIRRAMARPGR